MKRSLDYVREHPRYTQDFEHIAAELEGLADNYLITTPRDIQRKPEGGWIAFNRVPVIDKSRSWEDRIYINDRDDCDYDLERLLRRVGEPGFWEKVDFYDAQLKELAQGREVKCLDWRRAHFFFNPRRICVVLELELSNQGENPLWVLASAHARHGGPFQAELQMTEIGLHRLGEQPPI
jgi:hypothetical protein